MLSKIKIIVNKKIIFLGMPLVLWRDKPRYVLTKSLCFPPFSSIIEGPFNKFNPPFPKNTKSKKLIFTTH